jgi:hypothetical protein
MFGIVIIIILIWIYYIYLAHPNFKVINYDTLNRRFKTGDIILFHALNNINPIFIGSYYGHIGVVYVDPDDPTQTPYLFEAFSKANMPFYPKKHSNGIIVSELKYRINSYIGYCFYKELLFPVPGETQKDFKNFVDFALENFYYDEEIFQSSAKKILFNEDLNCGTNCGELTYLSLVKLGLLPLNSLRENRKHHLAWLSNLTLLKKNKYLTPVYIYSNNFTPKRS